MAFHIPLVWTGIGIYKSAIFMLIAKFTYFELLFSALRNHNVINECDL